jgi:hypothetical protein
MRLYSSYMGGVSAFMYHYYTQFNFHIFCNCAFTFANGIDEQIMLASWI